MRKELGVTHRRTHAQDAVEEGEIRKHCCDNGDQIVNDNANASSLIIFVNRFVIHFLPPIIFIQLSDLITIIVWTLIGFIQEILFCKFGLVLPIS